MVRTKKLEFARDLCNKIKVVKIGKIGLFRVEQTRFEVMSEDSV